MPKNARPTDVPASMLCLNHFERGAAELDLVGSVGKVTQRPAEPVETRDDPSVAFDEHLQRQLELSAAIALGSVDAIQGAIAAIKRSGPPACRSPTPSVVGLVIKK
jgi:hypothetical protein